MLWLACSIIPHNKTEYTYHYTHKHIKPFPKFYLVITICNTSVVTVYIGSQSKYLSGKRTEDTIYKCIGISVKLGGVGSGFSSGIESYFEEYVGRSIEEKTEHTTEGDGLHFTFYGPPTMISALRSEGSVGDDPVRAGDVVNLGTRGASLFLNTISIVRAERDNAMASLHQVTNLYHAPAVNVDDGLAENIKKAQALIKVRGGARVGTRSWGARTLLTQELY